MRPEDFVYGLPEGSVAAFPAEPRDAARLLVASRGGGGVEHRRFSDLPDFLREGDCLVLNETRVRPCRLVGRRASGARVEALVLGEVDGGRRALVRRLGRLRPGESIAFEDGALGAVLVRRLGEREAILAFPETPDLEAALEAHGRAPLPPYIHREGEDGRVRDLDRSRYQTVYARETGSVAAPTAGLHFTLGLLATIEAKGVRVARLTLHVGPGTFRPIRDEDLVRRRLDPEPYEIPEETAAAANEARARGGRVVAVGTTVVRALESAVGSDGRMRAGAGETELFVAPPFGFRAIDALVTNFHLPRSSLLLLVAAFAGRERILSLYETAVAEGYRFYSYGDAMLLG